MQFVSSDRLQTTAKYRIIEEELSVVVAERKHKWKKFGDCEGVAMGTFEAGTCHPMPLNVTWVKTVSGEVS